MRWPRQATTQQLHPQGGRRRWGQQQLLPRLSLPLAERSGPRPPRRAFRAAAARAQRRPDAIPRPQRQRQHHHWSLEVAAAAAAGAQQPSWIRTRNPGRGRTDSGSLNLSGREMSTCSSSLLLQLPQRRKVPQAPPAEPSSQASTWPSSRQASTWPAAQQLLRGRTRSTRHRSPRPHKQQRVGLPMIRGRVVAILRSNRIKIEYNQAKSGLCNDQSPLQ